jgi:hypothetical protein
MRARACWVFLLMACGGGGPDLGPWERARGHVAGVEVVVSCRVATHAEAPTDDEHYASWEYTMGGSGVMMLPSPPAAAHTYEQAHHDCVDPTVAVRTGAGASADVVRDGLVTNVAIPPALLGPPPG